MLNIFLSSNVNFYAILSYFLDSDSEILEMSFFFFFLISPVVTS